MADDFSFDIISKVDLQDLDNGINNVMKEISNRYDLKGTSSKVELNKGDNTVTMLADSDFHMDQIMQVVAQKFHKVGIDIKAIKSKGREKAAGDKVREVFTLVNGIEQEVAKKIVKDIKESKIKVQASIQGDQLRISGKSKDNLQDVMSLIRGKDYGIALQFTNYR